MVDETLTTCPLSPAGFCLYERCPYWDHGLNECTTCFQDATSGASGGSSNEFPCTITWIEDGD